MKKKYRVDHVRAVKPGERKVTTVRFTDLAEARAYFRNCELTPETRYIRLCELVRTPLSFKRAKTWKRINLRRGPALPSKARKPRGERPEAQPSLADGM